MLDRDVWDLYFVTIVGWTFHPGYQKPGSTQWTIEDCADMADQMMNERSLRWDGEPQ